MCCRCAARQGRALKPGDLLPLGPAAAAAPGLAVPEAWRPTYPEAGQAWEVGVLPGPNAAPDYFTEEDVQTLYSAAYTVHYNSCAAGLGTGCLLHGLLNKPSTSIYTMGWLGTAACMRQPMHCHSRTGVCFGRQKCAARAPYRNRTSV